MTTRASIAEASSMGGAALGAAATAFIALPGRMLPRRAAGPRELPDDLSDSCGAPGAHEWENGNAQRVDAGPVVNRPAPVRGVCGVFGDAGTPHASYAADCGRAIHYVLIGHVEDDTEGDGVGSSRNRERTLTLKEPGQPRNVFSGPTVLCHA